MNYKVCLQFTDHLQSVDHEWEWLVFDDYDTEITEDSRINAFEFRLILDRIPTHIAKSLNENQLRMMDFTQIWLYEDDICIVHVLSAA